MKFICPSQIIQTAIAKAINSNFEILLEPREISINLCYPKYDCHYTSTIALAISKRLGVDAWLIAEAIAQACSQNLQISSQWQLQAFGKGWLNISLREQYLYENLQDLDRWHPDGIDYHDGFWQKNNALNSILLDPEPMLQYAYARCSALMRLAGRENIVPTQYIYQAAKDISNSVMPIPMITLGWMEPLEVSLFLQNLATAEFLDLTNQDSLITEKSPVASKLARSLTTAFLNFYDHCRIFGVSQEIALRRLLLIKITQKLMLAIASPEIHYAMYL